MRFSVLAEFFCGFAVLDDFSFGFAVSNIPQSPPRLLTFRKQDSVQLPSFGRRLHLSMNKTLGTVIFQLTTNASRKIKKTTNTEVSKIDSKKRHAVFNNFKETDLRLFIKKKKQPQQQQKL